VKTRGHTDWRFGGPTGMKFIALRRGSQVVSTNFAYAELVRDLLLTTVDDQQEQLTETWDLRNPASIQGSIKGSVN